MENQHKDMIGLQPTEPDLLYQKTNKLRKEEAYGANETGTVHHSAHRRHHL